MSIGLAWLLLVESLALAIWSLYSFKARLDHTFPAADRIRVFALPILCGFISGATLAQILRDSLDFSIYFALLGGVVAFTAAYSVKSIKQNLVPTRQEQSKQLVELWMHGLGLGPADLVARLLGPSIEADFKSRCRRDFPNAFALNNLEGPILVDPGNWDPGAIEDARAVLQEWGWKVEDEWLRQPNWIDPPGDRILKFTRVSGKSTGYLPVTDIPSPDNPEQ